MNDVEFNTLINCHNPYFNRWFSAIYPSNLVQMHHNSHNPYFNRWFSAIEFLNEVHQEWVTGHNPYFNRWFSAIKERTLPGTDIRVTILILIDGFLQYDANVQPAAPPPSHNPYFNRWFSAIQTYG